MFHVLCKKFLQGNFAFELFRSPLKDISHYFMFFVVFLFLLKILQNLIMKPLRLTRSLLGIGLDKIAALMSNLVFPHSKAGIRFFQ